MISFRLIGLVALFALTACAYPSGTALTAPGSAWPDTRFAPTAEAVTAAYSIPLANSTPGLPKEIENELTRFAYEYKRMGHGPIIIHAPGTRHGAKRALALLGEVNRVLDASGIDTDAVTVRSVDTQTSMSEREISLHFTRYRATVPRCGRWNEDNIITSASESRSANLGCALARNLGVMISDPRDLIRPRMSDSPFATRRDTVLDAYAEGKATGTKRQDAESGAVSQINR